MDGWIIDIKVYKHMLVFEEMSFLNTWQHFRHHYERTPPQATRQLHISIAKSQATRKNMYESIVPIIISESHQRLRDNGRAPRHSRTHPSLQDSDSIVPINLTEHHHRVQDSGSITSITGEEPTTGYQTMTALWPSPWQNLLQAEYNDTITPITMAELRHRLQDKCKVSDSSSSHCLTWHHTGKVQGLLTVVISWPVPVW